MRILIPLACVVLLGSCTPAPTEPVPRTESAKPAAAPKPADESRRFPKPALLSTEVVDSALLGKSFMPGGTLAHYRKGKTEYQMFVGRAQSATDAAVKVGEWRTALAKPEFVASFGGYFGEDKAGQVFVFAKGEWIAGVVGLPRSQADLAARTLASGL